MKAKLLLYYLVSFVLACLIIISANILFMRDRIYNQENVYNYSPDELMVEIEGSIQASKDGAVSLNKGTIDMLSKSNIGLQVIDSNHREVYSYQKPIISSKEYTVSSILDLYGSIETTTFLGDFELDGKTYTYLLFFDPTDIKRAIYSYDVKLMQSAHSFTALITINFLLLLIISFIYTFKITRPISIILSKIVGLSKGIYEKSEQKAGIYSGIIRYLNDLGDKLAESKKEREHLEQMRDDWISNISHDIKTPLTSIIGNTEIIGDTRYSLSDDMREEYCSRILSQSGYIKTLVEDLNFSTKLNSPYFKLEKKPINIVSLMRHTLIDLLNDGTFDGESIQFNSSDENIIVDIDPSLMERVFINLLSNAFIHNKPDVRVAVYIKRISSGASISIEDDGIGVLNSDLENIFNRYYRGTNTSKGSKGSGLGLAITRDIVELHGASIEAMSLVNSGLKVEMVLK